MWENSQRLIVNRDHGLVIQKSSRPGTWFGAGKAILAPLYRKRPLLIHQPKWVHAWTLYNDSLQTNDWLISPDANSNLHFEIEVKTRNPTGWILTVPLEIRRKGWLPAAGGIVVYEYSDSEFNFWTEDAYNLESILEADAK